MDSQEQKRILIIGGAGFIGSHLTKLALQKNHQVNVLTRSKKRIHNLDGFLDKINLIVKDVKDINKADVENRDYIFYLAGTTDNYSIKEGNPYRDIQENCNSTISFLESCKDYNSNARIVFASTFFVNGNVQKLPVDSDSPCNPLGLYGATKLAAEHFCHVYNHVFGLDSIIARFTNVFGPFEESDNKKKAGFNYLINQAINEGKIYLYNNGDFFRDYIYVGDVAEACLTLAEKGESDKVYYVGRGEFVKFHELIDIVAREIHVQIIPVEPPEFHKRVGIKDFVSDPLELKKLGWFPRTSLEEGIKKTIEYYKKDGRH